MISVVIPTRGEQFLQKTINDILKKSTTEIEILPVCDGIFQEIEHDDRVKPLMLSTTRGMRAAINAGVAEAQGEYILKTDGHCMFDEGFDAKLLANIDATTIVIPRRWRLDPEEWKLSEVERGCIDYEYLSYPVDGGGLHGKQWNERTVERLNKPEYLIDDQMSFQGSCWFMEKQYFYFLELMDEVSYGPFWQEAQEIGLKAWLSGGRVVTNKNTWYAHLHKGSKYGRGFKLDGSWKPQGVQFANKWVDEKVWHKQIYPLSYLVDKFWPVPGWPEDYKSKIDKEWKP